MTSAQLEHELTALPALLRRNAALDAELGTELVGVTFEDGTTWTRRAALEAAYGAAATLREMGVAKGDRVAVALPSGPAFLSAWWGAALLGAVVVPVNLTYRGELLWQLLLPAQPSLVVTDATFVDRLLDRPSPLADLRVVFNDELGAPSCVDPAPDVEVHAWDPAAYMLTSGTTGPSKLVNTSHFGSFLGGDIFFSPWGLDSTDRFLVDLPLFHAAAFRFVHASLGTGTPIAVRGRPSLHSYWEVARDTGATATLLFSSMFSRLSALPARRAEREHAIRLVGGVPLPRDAEQFKARFGIERLHTAWGMTEVPAAVHVHPGIAYRPGSVGMVRAGFEVRLVDDQDREVPRGTPGHAVVRADAPWTIAHEYVGQPAATSRAWRNGWFHTGDILRQDEDGYFFFVDRDKDVVRRRGENISSFEVETVLLSHPLVAQAACVPVRRTDVEDGVDDDVKVWLVPAEGADLDLSELLEFCVAQLPHFMVPRFFEVSEGLPLTPSGKVEKTTLRANGNGPATWDREDHGLLVTRHGLERTSPAGG